MEEESETSIVSKPISDQGSSEENVNINEDESTKRLLETLSSPAEDVDNLQTDNTADDPSIPNVCTGDQGSSDKTQKTADEDLENSAIFQEIEKIHGGLERSQIDQSKDNEEPSNPATDVDNDDPLVHQNENEQEKREDEKDKTSQDNTIEHVDLEAGEEEEAGEHTEEYISIQSNSEVVDEDAGGESSKNALETSAINIENDDVDIQAENPLSACDNTEKDQLDVDKDKNGAVTEVADEDPIATDCFISENIEEADEELCIVPDSERVISQEEKDSADNMPPLCVISQATSAEEDDEDMPTTAAVVENDSEKYVVLKSTTDDLQKCLQCVLKRKVKYCITKTEEEDTYICTDTCLEAFKAKNPDKRIVNYEGEIRVKNLTNTEKESKSTFDRKCVVCKKKIDDEENNLSWEIMDFCNEFCLSKYQKEIGSSCTNCHLEVQQNSVGKYCVRFGNVVKQFCTMNCLDQYKKGLKVCTYCQQDMSMSEGFLAPVGDGAQFKNFCSQKCVKEFANIKETLPVVPEGTKCSVCKAENTITIEYEFDGTMNYFCSDRCFVAFNFVNNINPLKCSMCRRHFPNEVFEKHTMFYDNIQYNFCSSTCQNVYIIAERNIVPCVWCKTKKYNFDMIRRCFKTGPILNMCSITCLKLFQVSVHAVHSKRASCNFCKALKQPMYYLTMSDATIRDFCSYSCVMSFQNKFKKSPIHLNPVPAGEPKKSPKFDQPSSSTSRACDNFIPTTTGKSSTKLTFNRVLCKIPPLPLNTSSASARKSKRARPKTPTLPVISSVQSLANNQNGNYSPQQNSGSQVRSSLGRPKKVPVTQVLTPVTPQQEPIPPPEPITKIKHVVIIKPAPVPSQRNIGTNCRVKGNHKSTMMKPTTAEIGIQTDEREPEKVLIPVPIPMYMPSPLPMYNIPAPFPLPFPLPIPVPIFIPTTRNSAKGIMKEIKKIQVKIPTDPYEAELLMMAEMVAGDKKEENTDSESEVEGDGPADEGSFSPEPPDANNTFEDDMLQMALKMATELEEPAVDLEGALTANTITAPQGSEAPSEETVDESQPLIQHIPERQPSGRGRRRGRGRGGANAAKKRRLSSQQVEVPVMQPQALPPEPQEKPDAHLCLKYTFGVNAWKQWVSTKNTELEKASKFPKLFKTEILQMTSDELNFSLCLFVKEVRKPNGAEYAPDTIYYLCLGIQQYLFENNRIDNIFCDPYYEQFTDSLDEVAKKFSVLYTDSHYIVTRVEEEHLWESKQLGAHSPHVLLSTLMFFNTKHFNLTTVQEHMQLSFSHIMKHWKRNPAQAGAARVPGSRNVLLRFYPPQAAMQNNARKKKVYEQQENDENPLRCPVKLYEFYLSKCPESVKTRNDVFYLQPERSCVPDSPVWYSTTALPQDALEKMLHRVKMVKEINVALLTS